MNRRDTIIVAALVNAGLLIVLFISALKNGEDSEKIASSQETVPHALQEVAIVPDSSKKILGDEVDVVLKQYSQIDPLQAPPVAATATSFAEDLQVLTQPTIAIPVEVSNPVKESAALAWIEVKVKKGDMLEKLARQHKTTVAEIMKVNNLSSTQLKIGQVLKIASSHKETEVRPVVKAETAILDGAPAKFYTVKTGDSPWTIAVKNHMKVEDLLKLNNMTEEKARRLKPGDQIRIR